MASSSPQTSHTKYVPLYLGEDDVEDRDSHEIQEEKGFIGNYVTRQRIGLLQKIRSNPWISLLIGLCILFLFIIIYLLNLRVTHPEWPTPPYSPLREDGVVRYINTKYKPQKIFQSSTSEKVEHAWDSWLREHDDMILIPKAKAISLNLPETIEAFNDPGYMAYGLAVYHQMHCLNRIRKSFYPDKFFPNDSPKMIEFHKNHCFDMIRQSILCHGDVALVYWWNSNYSYVDESGIKHYTEEYLHRTPMQRAEGSFATWDTEVQCRDMDPINSWAKAHRLDDKKYGGQQID
ncbi:hypothetical protein F5884DRAFT_786191 [Xylogone sp. PMI_703]|nr:hypothetical protein F5884DRAFT_786191 [Xylogone sp. PMI_703]